MEMPNVVHPKRVKVGETLIEVATYFPVSDRHAQLIALNFVRSIKVTKKHKGKVLRTFWAGDQESLALLEPRIPPNW